MLCPDCQQDHEHQRYDYPLLGQVTLTAPTPMLDAGAHGTIIDYTADGRAVILFEDGNLHTFHHPETYLDFDHTRGYASRQGLDVPIFGTLHGFTPVEATQLRDELTRLLRKK